MTDAAGLSCPSLSHALAHELVLASRMLADLAYDLGTDADTVRRHMGSLQAIDRITQIQLAVADVLRSEDDVAGTLAGVTLEDMAERLRDAAAR